MDTIGLKRAENNGISWWTDEVRARELGIVFGFTERGGGVSAPPYASLNLAAHVGDEPQAVDENRTRLLDAAGLAAHRDNLVVPEQVHGEQIAIVTALDGGRGAHAATGRPPISSSDALVTGEAGVPLLLCFADCVPVVLAAPGPFVAVVHAGWRGALASLPGKAAHVLADAAGCDRGEIVAWVGPHIGACHYEVEETILSHFVHEFGTFARAGSRGLDLGFVVSESLRFAGVDQCNIAALGACTAETTDRFYSHRAEHGLTGRHAAFACIVPR